MSHLQLAPSPMLPYMLLDVASSLALLHETHLGQLGWASWLRGSAIFLNGHLVSTNSPPKQAPLWTTVYARARWESVGGDPSKGPCLTHSSMFDDLHWSVQDSGVLVGIGNLVWHSHRSDNATITGDQLKLLASSVSSSLSFKSTNLDTNLTGDQLKLLASAVAAVEEVLNRFKQHNVSIIQQHDVVSILDRAGIPSDPTNPRDLARRIRCFALDWFARFQHEDVPSQDVELLRCAIHHHNTNRCRWPWDEPS